MERAGAARALGGPANEGQVPEGIGAMAGDRPRRFRASRHASTWLSLASIASLLIGLLSATGSVAAQTTANADPSDVVIALDFSGSIMEDKAARTDFAKALEKIATAVNDHGADLTAGPATFTFVAFASHAVNYSDTCTRINVQGSYVAVGHLVECFQAVAREYRRGLAAPITRRVGSDTNYVDVFKVADKDLPARSKRPAVVFFTDGKHEVAGVPVSAVQPAANDRFGDRKPFAFLPVGMGLDPKTKAQLAKGLEGLRDLTTSMSACQGGQTFAWDTVVFGSAQEAGNAVALALQSVTCTFPAPNPTPTPVPATPSPTPPQPPDAPSAPVATSGDGEVTVSWLAPAKQGTTPVSRYDVRCRADGADWGETQTATPPATSVVVSGLQNGTGYECQVRAVSSTGPSEWASVTSMPQGGPEAPAGVTGEGADAGAKLAVQPGPDGGSPITDYSFECAPDGSSSWHRVQASPDVALAAYTVSGLTNEQQYTCRAYAINTLGTSAASPESNSFLVCSGPFQCFPWLRWLVAFLLALLLLLLALYLLNAWRNRARRYISAEVDAYRAIELGLGPDVGIVFNRDRRGRITDPLPSNSSPEIGIRYHGGGRFTVTGGAGDTELRSGEPATVSDTTGQSHQLVLRAAAKPQADDAID